LKKTKWSDGTPLVAHDFVSAWRSILDPNFPSEFAFELFFIKGARLAKENKIPLSDVGIQALADDVIEVHLERPVPYFLDMLTTSTFYPIPSHVIAKDSTWAKKGEKNTYATALSRSRSGSIAIKLS
jgi:ABC-type oligopeptide transport system substrate-binding subunit